MRIVVGLGNPGPEYATSRHNAGFLVVDRITRRWCISLQPKTGKLKYGEGRVCGARVLFLEPQTYMNKSGEALTEIYGGLVPPPVLVVHDDLDLSFGRLRVSRRAGAGGHRGVASIIETIGPDFDRLRVGVGRPEGGVRVSDYVLDPMSFAEVESLEGTLEGACGGVECWLTDGVDDAMSFFNANRS